MDTPVNETTQLLPPPIYQESKFIQLYRQKWQIQYPINLIFLGLIALSEFGFMKFFEVTTIQGLALCVYFGSYLKNPPDSILPLYDNFFVHFFAQTVNISDGIANFIATAEVQESVESIMIAIDKAQQKIRFNAEEVATVDNETSHYSPQNKREAFLMLLSFFIIYATATIASIATYLGLSDINKILAALSLAGQILFYMLILRAFPAYAIFEIREIIKNNQICASKTDKFCFFGFHLVAAINRGVRLFYIGQRLTHDYLGSCIIGLGGAYLNFASATVKQYKKQKNAKQNSWLRATRNGIKSTLLACISDLPYSEKLFLILSIFSVFLFLVNRILGSIIMVYTFLAPDQIYDGSKDNLEQQPVFWKILTAILSAIILIPANILLAQFIFDQNVSGWKDVLYKTPKKLWHNVTTLCHPLFRKPVVHHSRSGIIINADTLEDYSAQDPLNAPT